MSSTSNRLAALALLAASSASSFALSGCSLIWTPVVDPDGGVVDEDTWLPDDASEDAPVDAWIAPDAWAPPPPEVDCDNRMDEDDDDLVDCNDPDCFGTPVCCDASSGVDLGASLGAGVLPGEWSDRDLLRGGTASGLRLSAAGAARLGTLWRNRCVPLGQGAHLQLTVAGNPMSGSGESLTIVLSPADEPSGDGFLSELAIHIDDANRATVTRSGRRIDLLPSGCVSANAAQLGPNTTFVLDLLPGVANEQSVLLTTLRVQSTGSGCASQTDLFANEAILAADLVRTPEHSSGSCQDSPGLYFGIEVRPGTTSTGGFTLVGMPSTASVVLEPLECASPGVFSRSSVVLDRTSVDEASAVHNVGGIGAPDLTYAGSTTGWVLGYDASVEDRSEELFRSLTLSLGVGTASAPDSDIFAPSPTSPISGTGPRAREPSLTFQGVVDPIVLFAREHASGMGQYELRRGTLNVAGSVSVHEAIVEPGDGCDSLREPTSALTTEGTITEWIFARCDGTTGSSLRLWRRASGTVTAVDDDVLEDDTIGDRVIAADVLTAAGETGRLFALWVLARDATDVGVVHLYLANQVGPGETPEFVPYAGNPVLREGDGSFAPCEAGARCTLTSLSVAQIARAGSDRLRFVFARSRTGPSVAYELVAAEQTALRGLDP